MDDSCPECGGKSEVIYSGVSSFHSDRKFDIKMCGKCSLCFTYPFGVNTKQFYSEENYGYERIRLQKAEKKFRNRYYSKLVSKYAKKRVLEIGCMFGFFLGDLKDRYDVEGIEPGKEPCKEARRSGLECFNGTVEEYTRSHRMKFDTVMAFHVIEHVNDLGSFLGSAAKVLENDGTLILAVPNFGAAKRLKGKWGWNLVPAHQYHFTKESMTKLLEKNGFRVENVVFRGGDSAFYMSCIYNMIGMKGGKNMNRTVARLIYGAVFNIVSRHTFGRGNQEMIVIAKKR